MKFLVIGSKSDKSFGAAMNRAFDCDFINSKDKDLMNSDVISDIDLSSYDVVVLFERPGMYKKSVMLELFYKQASEKELNIRFIVVDFDFDRSVIYTYDRMIESRVLREACEYYSYIQSRDAYVRENDVKVTYVGVYNLEKLKSTLNDFNTTSNKELINSIKWLMSVDSHINHIELRPKKLKK